MARILLVLEDGVRDRIAAIAGSRKVSEWIREAVRLRMDGAAPAVEEWDTKPMEDPIIHPARMSDEDEIGHILYIRDQAFWLRRVAEYAEMDAAEARRALAEDSGGVKIPADIIRQGGAKLANWLLTNAQ